ncbi:MAG: hypothetical protein JJU00_17970 [Opitutales bacterium]|nr:hypothetical protein [Opitutales bacterium]
MAPQFEWIPPGQEVEIAYAGRQFRADVLFPDDPAWAYRRKPVRLARADHVQGKTVSVRLPGRAVGTAAVETLAPCRPPVVDGDTIRFTPPAPGHYVIRADSCFACFLFLDPAPDYSDLTDGRTIIEADTLQPGAPVPQTAELQALIDRAARERRGTILRLPPGTLLTGTLRMRSGVYLHIHDDTVLKGTPDRTHYPVDPKVAGLSIARSRLLHFLDVEDCGLIGRGAVDGNGSLMRHRALLEGERQKRVPSNLVRIHRCSNLHFRDVSLRDSEFWNTHILDSENIHFRNTKLINEIPPRQWDPVHPDYTWNNADGINPDASREIRVDGLFAYCGDDCLPVKNTGNARDPRRGTEDCVFRDLTLVSETTVMKIGTETRGPVFRNIRFENILQLDSGAPMGVMLRDGATVESLIVKNLRALRCRGAPYLRTERRRPEQAGPPGVIGSVSFEDWDLRYAGAGPDTVPAIELEQSGDLRHLCLNRITVNGTNTAIRPTLPPPGGSIQPPAGSSN